MIYADDEQPLDVKPVSQPPTQFSLRWMFGLTAGFAALFALLTALGLEAAQTLIAFGAASASALLASGIVTLVWSAGDGPTWRPVGESPHDLQVSLSKHNAFMKGRRSR